MSRINVTRLQTAGNCRRNKDLRSRPPVFLLDAPVILLSLLAVMARGIEHFHMARASSRLTVWLPYSHTCPRPSMLCSVAAQLFFRRSVVTNKLPFLKSSCKLLVRQSVGAVLAARLLSTSNPMSAMHFISISAFVSRSAGLLLVLTVFTVNLPSLTSRCLQTYWTSMCLSSRSLDDVLCQWPQTCHSAAPKSAIMEVSSLIWVSPQSMP